MLPREMLRPNALVCFGEHAEDWLAASRDAGAPHAVGHAYRGVHAAASDDVLSVLAPWGSPVVEAILWELTEAPTLARCVLWGTAGALPGARLPRETALAVDEAVAHHVAGLPDGLVGRPTLRHRLPIARAVSTDRFYGASPAGAAPRYGDGALWGTVRTRDALVDMESAPFYVLMSRFAPHVATLAVRGIANDVADVHAMPHGAPSALRVALDGALRALG